MFCFWSSKNSKIYKSCRLIELLSDFERCFYTEMCFDMETMLVCSCWVTKQTHNHITGIILSSQDCTVFVCRWAFKAIVHSKNTRVRKLTRKGSIGAKLHSGSTMTRKSVNLTRNVTRSWVNLTSLLVKSAKSWPISGSSLTRNGVWPQWTLFRVTLTLVFLECSFGELEWISINLSKSAVFSLQTLENNLTSP